VLKEKSLETLPKDR